MAFENTVEKGEIALYEPDSFSQSVFKRLALQICKNTGLFENGYNLPKYDDNLTPQLRNVAIW